MARITKNIFRDTLKVLKTASYFDFECTFRDRAGSVFPVLILVTFIFLLLLFLLIFFFFFGHNYERPQTEIFGQANKKKIGPRKKMQNQLKWQELNC